ncbi:MAG: PKD domain-containing protein [Flavobacteriaceae bacterium]|nr:PKD domain-containing protein [Flavobacteriaceae bacterium]
MRFLIAFLSLIFVFSCSSSDPEPTPDPDQNDPGSAPEITSLVIESEGKMAGDEITVRATVSDPDNDITSYDWTVAAGTYEVVSNTEIAWMSPGNPGDYEIALQVTDADGNSDNRSQQTSLTLGTANFQNFIDANYVRLYSRNYVATYENHIYFYSAEVVTDNTWEYSLRKFDLDGNLIWRRGYLETTSFSNGRPISITSDGNIIMTFKDSITKVNTDGDIVWQLPTDQYWRFNELENGNYFFASKTGTPYEPRFLVVSSNGMLVNSGLIEVEEFTRWFADIAPGPQPNTSYLLVRADGDTSDIRTLVLHMDGNGQILDSFQLPYLWLYYGCLFANGDDTYTAFLTDTDEGRTKIHKVVFNTNGEVLDDIAYSWNNYQEVSDVYRTLDGGFLVAGEVGASDNDTRSLMFKIDTNGTLEWNNFYGDYSSQMDKASGILELPNGKVVVSGSTFIPGGPGGGQVKSYLHKYNPDGSL